MSEEIWKDVIEFPDLFMISTHGRVWSKRTRKILKHTILKSGYPCLSSRIGGRKGKAICKRIHRWVAIAFIPNSKNKPHVNHIDGDKMNPHVDNLEWCTEKENIKHAWDNGLMGLDMYKRGENRKNSKLSDSDIREIRRLRSEKIPSRKVGEMFGISHSTVQKIQKRKMWSHVE